MNYATLLIVSFILTGWMINASQAQRAPRRAPQSKSLAAPPTTRETSHDSIKYHIMIVPHDTTEDERMPAYAPDDFIPVDEPPVPIRMVPAEYPAAGNRRKPEGTVWVKCYIQTDGTVGKTEIMRTDGQILNAVAVAALRQWLFSPAKVKGKPIAVWAAVPVRVRPKK